MRGPLPPGESIVALRYHLPAPDGAVALALRFPLQLPLLSVFVSDTGVRADTDRMHRRRSFRTDDRSYLHLEAFQVGAGEAVDLALSRLTPRRPLPMLARAGFAVLLAAVAVAFLIAPLRSRDAEPALLSRRASHAAAERESVLAALRDLEEDFATGKLDPEDHAQMRTELRARAVALLAAERDAPAPAAATAPPPSRAARAAPPRARPAPASARAAASASAAPSAAPGRRGMSEPALRASGLGKRFGRSVALDGVDLELPAGASLAVLGPNGAGKSTLLRLIAGLARPTAGSLTIAGMPAHRPAARAPHRLHRPRVAPVSVADRAREPALRRAAATRSPGAAGRVERWLEESGLARVADLPVSHFSRGMSQRLSIARGLVHDPSLLLLDEPFTGLDPRAATRLAAQLASLHAAGRTLVLVTHDPGARRELSDRAIVLGAGRVVFESRGGAAGAEALERAVLAASDSAA